jgi:hypothetical protein
MKTPNPSTNCIRSSSKWSVLLCLLLLIGCLELLPKAQAVSPPPDGGYPNGTTAEGDNALLSLTTGLYNTAVGFYSLASVTTGDVNTAIGTGALFFNTADQNTATGAGALFSNTTGDLNTASGAFALVSNTTGGVNTAVGAHALQSNTTGSGSVAVGWAALQFNTIGRNTAIGAQAMQVNTTGTDNTAVGYAALGFTMTGRFNTALGVGAGQMVTGNRNIVIGSGNLGFAGENDTIRIGRAPLQTRAFIAGIHGVTTGNNDAVPVVIDSDGQLGTVSSSSRYKTDIKPIEKASESILSLQPVSFRYKVHKDTTPNFGLIAEEVARVNPDLVFYDADGKPYTVRYDAVNAMLLNEFLKEHRKVQELEANGVRQQKQIEALAAGLQRVSAQVEMSRPTPQVVVNQQ